MIIHIAKQIILSIMHKKILKTPFVRFIIVCSVAAMVNFESRILIGIFTSYVTSIVLAYLFGMLIAYLLCRQFVFQPKKNNTAKQVSGFLLINITGILLTTTVSLVLANHGLLFIHPKFERLEIAHFIGLSAPAISSYIGHKYLSFR